MRSEAYRRAGGPPCPECGGYEVNIGVHSWRCLACQHVWSNCPCGEPEVCGGTGTEAYRRWEQAANERGEKAREAREYAGFFKSAACPPE